MNSKILFTFLLALASLFLPSSVLSAAEPPGVMNHQGRIAVNGANYTGTGYFKFSFITISNSVFTTLWSNDGTGFGTSQATTAVPVTVTNGHYAVLLGDTSLTNMTQAIPAGAFANHDNVKLHVWFSTDNMTFERLVPDRRVATSAYAFSAARAETAESATSLPEGTVTSAMLQDGAVTIPKLQPSYYSNAYDVTDPFAGFSFDPGTGTAQLSVSFDQPFASGTVPQVGLVDGWSLGSADEAGFTASANYAQVVLDAAVADDSTSLAIVDGRPAISYRDNGLKFAIAPTPDGSGAWAITSFGGVDSGRSSSLAVIDGRPAISYVNTSTGELIYAICSTADGTGLWVFTTIASGLGGTEPTSLSEVNGRPMISFYDPVGKDLLVAIAGSADGATGLWVNVTLDSVGDVGRFSSLAAVDGRAAISYHDATNTALKFAIADTADPFSSWTTTTVDADLGAGQFTSLAVVAGRPAISSMNFASFDLKFSIASSADGSGPWTTTTVDSAGSVGLYSSLAVVGGRPAISHFRSNSGDLRFALAASPDGSGTWTTATIDSAGSVGRYTSLAVVEGRAAVSYTNSTNTELRFVRLPPLPEWSASSGEPHPFLALSAKEAETADTADVATLAEAVADGAVSGLDSADGALTDVLQVSNSGFVGINNLSPTAALDVNGTIQATSFQGSGAPLTLGTTDPNALQLLVNNTVGLELLYPAIGSVPNIIGGYGGNSIAPGNEGSVIGGGGSALGAAVNTIDPGSDYAVIAGGARNTAAGDLSTIGGGIDNRTDGLFAVVPGGVGNAATADHTFAAGRRAKAGHLGAFVWADSTDADFASTGSDQFLVRAAGGVGIGTTDPQAALDVAGTFHATGFRSEESTTGTIPNIINGAGMNSVAAGVEGATIAGGGGSPPSSNIINAGADFSVISGGNANAVTGLYGVIGGGFDNTAGALAVAAGGFRSSATGPGAFVGAGNNNTASGSDSVVGGGFANTAAGDTSFAAGRRAKANHAGAFVWADTIDADFASTGDNQFAIRADGGVRVFAPTDPTLKLQSDGTNEISGRVSLRQSNDSGYDMYYDGTSGVEGLVFESFGSGNSNGKPLFLDLTSLQVGIGTTDPTHRLTIDNSASQNALRLIGPFDGTLGTGARMNFGDGNFVFVEEPFDDGMHIQANEVGIGGSPTDGGARLQVTGSITATGTITPSSDRNMKRDFEEVDGAEVLAKVVALPLQRWTYKAEEDGIRHLGPMAQDFHAAFDLGANDVSIATVDADGVSLAAIQGLHRKVEDENTALRAENEQLRTETEALRERLERLEAAVSALARPDQES